jgi:hypothetical protein
MHVEIETSEDTRWINAHCGKASVGVWFNSFSETSVRVFTDLTVMGVGRGFQSIQEAIAAYKRPAIKAALEAIADYRTPANCIPFRRKVA